MPPRTDRPEEEILAADVRHRLRLGYGRVDPFEIAKRLGLEVVRYPVQVEKGVEGQYAPVLDGEGAIFVNSATSLLRQRFTAAHEIGHFILHRDVPVVDTDLFGSPQGASNPTMERQADRFAGALLVDETGATEIAQRAASLDAAVAEVVDTFEVSVPTAAIALRQFGLLSQTELDSFLTGYDGRHREFMRANDRRSRHEAGSAILELDPDFQADVIEMLARGQVPAKRAAGMLDCAVEDLPAEAIAAATALADRLFDDEDSALAR